MEGVRQALNWLAENVPVYAVNLIITTAHEMWAVRWPETHELFLLDQRKQPVAMEHRTSYGMRISSPEMGFHPSVVVASEMLDPARSWQRIGSGELVHVGADLSLTHIPVADGPPRRLLAH